ncbi:MAG: molecular chaperone DnaJ [Herpetosiphonaceae bacterium]|nr:MAG: molecular chaperone DnaJ [Herpetosiphonaceae bacterium]
MYDFESLDHYQILGISRSATPEGIKKAYRREIARYHPDRYHSASPEEQNYARARTQRINEAYRVLSSGARTGYTTRASRHTRSLKEQLASLYSQARALLGEGRAQEAAALLRRIQQIEPFYRDSAALLEQAEAQIRQQAGAVPARSRRWKQGAIAGAVGLGGVGVIFALWNLAGRPQPHSPVQSTDAALAPILTAEASLPGLDSEPPIVATRLPSVPALSATPEPSATPAPSSTPQPSPTAAPSPTSRPPTATIPVARADDLDGEVLFTDTFSGGRWSVARGDTWTLEFVDGRYHMIMEPGVGSLWSYSKLPVPADNIVISVDVEPRQGSAGMLFGFIDGSNHYRLLSGADGSYRLEQRVGGSIQALASGQGAGSGRLSLVLRGTSAQIYFNRTLLNQVQLPGAPAGSFGLALASNGAGEAFFDTLIIRRAP